MDAFIRTETGPDLGEGLVDVGAKVFVRTVTHYYTGEVVAVTSGFLHLINAAWIADMGRFAGALASGAFNEVEPYPGEGRVAIGLGAIVDISPWSLALPRTQK